MVVAPYGSWKSPITADLAIDGVSLKETAVDGNDIYWVEGRPLADARNVIMKNGKEFTSKDFNPRTGVYEYGGGIFTVDNGVVYFANGNDNGIYRQESATELIFRKENNYFADFSIDRKRGGIIAILEDQTNATARNARHSLVRINKDSLVEIEAGNDFYSNPRISPDGKYMTWMTWNRPNMQWDGSEVWIGKLDKKGNIVEKKLVAGGERESIFQPSWSPDNLLHFISDRSGWWNLYRFDGKHVENLQPREAEFSKAQWFLNMSYYGFTKDGIIAAYNEKGLWTLGKINPRTLKMKRIETPCTEITYVAGQGDVAAFVGGAADLPFTLFQLQNNRLEAVKRASSVALNDYVSVPEPIEFKSGDDLAHAFLYLPKNKDFTGPKNELPPLLVHSHGGPTGASTTERQFSIQYFTSRGFAVADLNYRGSTGYGTEYRRKLFDAWGIVDVEDAVNLAKSLAEKGIVDKNRMVISGASSGGYTALAALTFSDVFKTGASHYGIGDLCAFDRETHKLESQYCYFVVGKSNDVLKERSPFFNMEKLNRPMIFFQGLKDKIVPPNQSQMMADALRDKGLPVAYLSFADEGHDFARGETIKRALEAELYFYSKILGFELGDKVEPLEIANLK